MSRKTCLVFAIALGVSARSAIAHPGHEPLDIGHWLATDHLLVLAVLALAALVPAAPVLIRAARAYLTRRD
jgi:hypothetical protein